MRQRDVDRHVAVAPLVSDPSWARGPLPRLDGLLRDERRGLAQRWAAEGQSRHAAIARLHHMAIELMRHGGPPELITRVQTTSLDMLRQARACFALASSYGETPVGPGPLPAPTCSRGSLPAFAAQLLLEEGIPAYNSVALCGAAVGKVNDDGVRAVLEAMTEDDHRRGQTAFLCIRWTVEVGGEPVRTALQAALQDPRAQEVGSQMTCFGDVSRCLDQAWVAMIWPSLWPLIAPTVGQIIEA
jgi:hypothetical protein